MTGAYGGFSQAAASVYTGLFVPERPQIVILLKYSIFWCVFSLVTGEQMSLLLSLPLAALTSDSLYMYLLSP